MTNINTRFAAWLAQAIETVRIAACVQNRMEFEAPWQRRRSGRC